MPTLVGLTKAALTNSWESRKQNNRLKERLSNREEQMKVQDESQQTKEKLFKMAHTKMGAQNTNIRMMETRLKDLQKMCD